MSYIYIPKPNLKHAHTLKHTRETREFGLLRRRWSLGCVQPRSLLGSACHLSIFGGDLHQVVVTSDSSPFANYFQPNSSRPRDSLMSRRRTSDPGSGREACLVVPLLCSLFWLLVGASSLVCMSKFTGLAHVVALVVVKQLL